METKFLDIKGKEQGTIELPESLFSVKPNPTFLHEVITGPAPKYPAPVKNRGNRKAPAAPARAACALRSSATAVLLSGLPRTLIANICLLPNAARPSRSLCRPNLPKATSWYWTA